MSDQRPTLKAVGAPRTEDALESALVNARATLWAAQSMVKIAFDHDLGDDSPETLRRPDPLSNKVRAQFKLDDQRRGRLEERGRGA